MRTEYFIADEALAATLAEDGPAGSGVAVLTLDEFEPMVVAGVLWGIVAADVLEFDPLRFDTWTDDVTISDDELSTVVRIADGFVDALAALTDDRIPAVAARWATSDEWFAAGPDLPEDIPGMLRALRDFARQAVAAGQPVFVRYST